MNKKLIRYGIIVISIIIIVLLLIYNVISNNQNSKNPNEKNLYTSNNINVEEFQTSVGTVKVTGTNQVVIKSYLASILNTEYNNIGINVNYKTEPMVDELYAILQKNNIKTINTKLVDAYNNIYKQIQLEKKQEKNINIIENIINIPTNLTEMTNAQIDSKTAKLNLTKEQINIINQNLYVIKEYYLNQFNGASAV